MRGWLRGQPPIGRSQRTTPRALSDEATTIGAISDARPALDAHPRRTAEESNPAPYRGIAASAASISRTRRSASGSQ